MKNVFFKTVILCGGIALLSGCATYKFQHGQPPYDKGYLALRDDKALLEYTVGEDNTVPGIKLAKERFNRRKRIVEDYYKRMGVIQNHFTMVAWEPTINFWKMVGGVFRLPFIAISDYRYEHNPKYKEKIRKLEDGKDLKEIQRVQKIKDKLSEYVKKDLTKESSLASEQGKGQIAQLVSTKPADAKEEKAVSIPEEKTPEPVSKVEEKVEEQSVESSAPVESMVEQVPAGQKTEPGEEAQPAQKPIEEKQPQAVSAQEEEKKAGYPEEVKAIIEEIKQDLGIHSAITAKPIKGYSPLKVQFNGRKSTSMHGKIVSYLWDFGDGEASAKPNPVNTYWSTTYGSRFYTATLTVKDEKGNSAVSTISIEVLTK